MLKPSFRSLACNWWYVLAWLGVIRAESTDMASANNTSTVLYAVIAAIAPHVEHSFVAQLDAVLRKTGHFLGYGILAPWYFWRCEIPIATGFVRRCGGPGEFICVICGGRSGR